MESADRHPSWAGETAAHQGKVGFLALRQCLSSWKGRLGEVVTVDDDGTAKIMLLSQHGAGDESVGARVEGLDGILWGRVGSEVHQAAASVRAVARARHKTAWNQAREGGPTDAITKMREQEQAMEKCIVF